MPAGRMTSIAPTPLLGAIIVILIAGGIAILSPPLAVAALAIGLAPLMTLGVLAALTVVALLFSPTATALTGQEAFSSTDEILLVVFVIAAVVNRLIRRHEIRRLPGTIPLIGFLALGALSSLIQAVPFEIAITSAFIIMKGWILAFALAQLTWDDRRIRSATRFGAWLIAIAIAVGIANIVLGSQWTGLFKVGSEAEVRFGITSIQGLFTVPLAAGNAMAGGFILILTHALVHGFTRRHAILLAGAGALTVLSGRRTAVLGGLVAAMVVGLKQRATSTALTLVVIVPLAAVSAWSTITEAASSAVDVYVSRTDAARTVLHRDMFDVANSHFPFGAGFGRFGSYVAGSSYSPEYTSRGYENIWGLSTESGNSSFLTDTQWPTMIAEPGYIGATFAVIAILSLVVFAWRHSRADDATTRWLGLATLGLTTLMLVASFGLPVFFGSSPPQAILFTAIGVLVGRIAHTRDATTTTTPRTPGRRLHA